MTRGISKDRLLRLREFTLYPSDAREVYDELIAECTELNPWMPIKDAPNDVPLLVECKGEGKKIHTHRIMVRAFMDRRSWILY